MDAMIFRVETRRSTHNQVKASWLISQCVTYGSRDSTSPIEDIGSAEGIQKCFLLQGFDARGKTIAASSWPVEAGGLTLGDIVFQVREESLLVTVKPFTGTTLYWRVIKAITYISTSAIALADLGTTQIDTRFIALSMVPTLPQAFFGDLSPWRDVHTVPDLCMVRINWHLQPTYERAWQLNLDTVNTAEKITLLRERFLQLIEGYSRSEMVSADVSGGIDSAANVYLLHSIGATFLLFRTNADTAYNTDYKWAQRISADVHQPITALGTLGEGSRAFEVTEPYPNGQKPELPLYWSDTEGYLRSIVDELPQSTSKLHLTGLGGDELFSPLPATPWSIAREKPWKLASLTLRHSSNERLGLISSLRDLTDNTDFRSQLFQVFEYSLSNEHKFDLQCGWCEPIALPSLLSQAAKELLSSTVKETSATLMKPLNMDRGRHQALSSLLMQSRILGQANHLFGTKHIGFQSPFLDERIIRLVLSVPSSDRFTPALHKGLLYRALRGIMPIELFQRPVKGEYSASLFQRWNQAKKTLSSELGDGLVAAMGLIDVMNFRGMLEMPVPDVNFVFAVERLAAIERWVRNVS